MQLKGPVELSVAADSSMMLVVRLATAGVVARAGLTLDAMDNLKMAAEEACNCLIGQQSPPERVSLCFESVENELRITARAVNDRTLCGGIDDAEMDVVRCIFESLADRVEFDVHNGRIRAVVLHTALS